MPAAPVSIESFNSRDASSNLSVTVYFVTFNDENWCEWEDVGGPSTGAPSDWDTVLRDGSPVPRSPVQ